MNGQVAGPGEIVDLDEVRIVLSAKNLAFGVAVAISVAAQASTNSRAE